MNILNAPVGRIGNLCSLEHQSRSKNRIETASTLNTLLLQCRGVWRGKTTYFEPVLQSLCVSRELYCIFISVHVIKNDNIFFKKRNRRKISQRKIKTHHRPRQISQALREGVRIRVLKNYILRRNFLWFHLFSWTWICYELHSHLFFQAAMSKFIHLWEKKEVRLYWNGTE